MVSSFVGSSGTLFSYMHPTKSFSERRGKQIPNSLDVPALMDSCGLRGGDVPSL